MLIIAAENSGSIIRDTLDGFGSNKRYECQKRLIFFKTIILKR